MFSVCGPVIAPCTHISQLLHCMSRFTKEKFLETKHAMLDLDYTNYFNITDNCFQNSCTGKCWILQIVLILCISYYNMHGWFSVYRDKCVCWNSWRYSRLFVWRRLFSIRLNSIRDDYECWFESKVDGLVVNNPALYLGSPGQNLGSNTGYSVRFYCIVWIPPCKCGIVGLSEIRPRMFPFILFPVHYSLSSCYQTLYGLSRWINK
jgi:hypothetical protein